MSLSGGSIMEVSSSTLCHAYQKIYAGTQPEWGEGGMEGGAQTASDGAAAKLDSEQDYRRHEAFAYLSTTDRGKTPEHKFLSRSRTGSRSLINNMVPSHRCSGSQYNRRRQ